MSTLPVELAWHLAIQPPERRWLIEGLWADQAVGIVGGEPKSCKSFLALDMAVAVASGAPCLRRFPVTQRGRVLLFAAEDALHIVRQRLDWIANAAGASLRDLGIHVITAPVLRLDLADDQRRLAATAELLKPTLLVLDPFVRLHRIDENAVADVAPLLAYLRELQRRLGLAIVLVHHSRKGAGNVRAGQALRGSSEFHAWGDSYCYMRRHGAEIILSVEHRAAPSLAAIPLVLKERNAALTLEIIDSPIPVSVPAVPEPSEKVVQVLERAATPLSLASLRASCHMRTANLCAALADLTRHGLVLRTPTGYALRDASNDGSSPAL